MEKVTNNELFTITIKSARLKGYFTLPTRACGVVIILPGSGSHIDQASDKQMAGMLYEKTIGTLLFNLLPNNERGQEFLNETPRLVVQPEYKRELVNRVKKATDDLAKRCPNLPIGYLGVSTGATIAFCAAAEDKRVKAVVSCGGRPDVTFPNTMNKLNAPTLFITGSQDCIPHEKSVNAFRRMQKLHKKVKLQTIKGANHGFTGNALQQAMEKAIQHFSNVFKFNKHGFQKVYKSLLLEDFCHGPVIRGSIGQEDVQSIIQSLNQKMEKLKIPLRYNKGNIATQLEGGACSAIAFECAKHAVKAFEQNNFVDQVKKLIYDKNQIMKRKKRNASKIREQIRNIQAALNTFYILDKNEKGINFSQEKIRAIAAYFDLTVTSSTKKMNVDSNLTEEKFIDQVSGLEPGVYVLRLIQDADNEKLEEKGHTIIFVKKSDLFLYFDVNYGLYLGKEKKMAALIIDMLKVTKNCFGLDYYQFHKLGVVA